MELTTGGRWVVTHSKSLVRKPKQTTMHVACSPLEKSVTLRETHSRQSSYTLKTKRSRLPPEVAQRLSSTYSSTKPELTSISWQSKYAANEALPPPSLPYRRVLRKPILIVSPFLGGPLSTRNHLLLTAAVFLPSNILAISLQYWPKDFCSRIIWSSPAVKT